MALFFSRFFFLFFFLPRPNIRIAAKDFFGADLAGFDACFSVSIFSGMGVWAFLGWVEAGIAVFDGAEGVWRGAWVYGACLGSASSMARFAVQLRLMLWRNSLLKVRRMRETLKGWLLPIGVFLYVGVWAPPPTLPPSSLW